jgi:hypothetical protein
MRMTGVSVKKSAGLLHQFLPAVNISMAGRSRKARDLIATAGEIEAEPKTRFAHVFRNMIPS